MKTLPEVMREVAARLQETGNHETDTLFALAARLLDALDAPICRPCSQCDGNHHWMITDGAIDDTIILGCKHCDAIRRMTNEEECE